MAAAAARSNGIATTANGKAKKKSKTAAVIKHKATSPMVKFADMRASGALRMSTVKAKTVEKMVHARASLRKSLANIRHPVNPVYKAAARESAKETKAAATERRKQAVAAAEQIAARKRANVRERRARELQRSVF